MGTGNLRVRTPTAVRLLLPLLISAIWPACASAQPVTGPHESFDYRLTTTKTNAPTGWTFNGSYHAAGNNQAYPPYMRKMTFYHPPGIRFDTSVPDRCTATDIELAVRGAAACPAGSRIGGGTIMASFAGGQPMSTPMDMFNNTNEQIVVAQSPIVTSVVRSRMHPDGSVEYSSPTCWPTVAPLPCPVDTVLQLGSSMRIPPYTRTDHGRVRSYLTTPPTCPASGHWTIPIRMWWADGSGETVVTKHPCAAPAKKPSHRRKRHRRH